MLSLLLSTVLSANAQQVITVSATGTCPGQMTYTVSGFTPGGTWIVFKGSAGGASPLPAAVAAQVPACAGVTLDLGNARYMTGYQAVPDPLVRVQNLSAAGVCGEHVQVLDATTCVLSAPVRIGG